MVGLGPKAKPNQKNPTLFPFEVGSQFSNGLISNRNRPRLIQNEQGNTMVAPNEKKPTEAKLTLNSELHEKKAIITLPIRTVSELNSTEHWTKKHKRHRIQQKTIAIVLNPIRKKISLPCHIHLTRFAPRKLDKHDNLPASMKYILDACCSIITGNFIAGRADDNEKISISYDQIHSSQYAVKIEFTF